ncbi:hypothetical protein PMZ80_004204 [Knufia obscura]|uniref:Uncharacterized protein n=1 Tax=Knufia obscura TaxID=1635080 RepID=A0ABR0RRL4_9EURO|nr:hypothetical protein PMZ80_004204 [Knufia obscura]
MPNDLVFVNYNNPVQQHQNQQLKSTAASHIGKYYRNRSRPLQKQFESGRKHTLKTLCSKPTTNSDDSSRVSPPVLFKGNSDPFSSHALDIDPRTSGLIAFFKGVVLPAMSTGTTRGWVFWQSTFASVKVNINTCETLYDPRFAHCFLARVGFVASKLAPSYLPRTLTLLGKSMSALRQTLAGGEDILSPATYPQVVVLFSIEVFCGNQKAAAAHGVVLQSIFDIQRRKQRVHYAMLYYTLFMDAHYSAMFLVPPLFDAEYWYTYDPDFSTTQLEPLLETAHGTPEEQLHEAIIDASTRDILLDVRRLVHSWQQYYSEKVTSPVKDYAHVFYQVLVCQQRIVESYHAASCEGPLCDTAQQSVLLSALIWFRKLIFQINVCGFDLYNAVPSILERLHNNLRLVDEQGQACVELEPHTKFWILFSAVQAGRGRDMQNDHRSQWFMQELSKQAQSLGLRTWESAVQVLKKFVFSDLVQPHGETWFRCLLELPSLQLCLDG